MASHSLLKGAEVLQKYDYSYGTVDLATGNVNAAQNNGQLSKVEGWIGANKQWSQRFGYDELGRLKESHEYKQGNNGQLTYKQVFDYDRFGNLYRKAASNPTAGQANPIAYTPIEATDISKATNRFTAGTTYDDAGQVVTDNKFRTMSFGYDANGRQVKATRSGVPDAWTVYDALGNRVGTKVNDIWQYVVYDAFGKAVAEYGAPPEGLGGVKYVQQDWQGSVRTVTNNNGFVVSRTDHQAFGGEIGYGTGLRSIEQGYNVDKATRQGYGLTERDEATGLDHAWFRKNENFAGRWTGPDPYKGSMSSSQPQSFNRYSYVGNDPTNFVDPSGLLMIIVYTGCAWDGAWYCSGYYTIETGWGGYHPLDSAGGGGGAPSPEPATGDCPFQSFDLVARNGLTAAQMSEIAQTAVGEASNYHAAGEVSFIIAQMQNMVAVNVAYAQGSTKLATYGKADGGKPVRPGTGNIDNIINEFDGRSSFGNTGNKKLNQEKSKNKGKLPEGYVCDQLKEAINYLSQEGLDFSGASMVINSKGITQNRGIGAYKTNVGYLDFMFQVGDTKFYRDRRNAR